MASFDAKKYKSAVLRTYSTGEEAEQLREVLAAMTRDAKSDAYARLDLNTLFAVPTPVKSAELQQWRPAIISALNKAQGLPAGKMIKQLLEALESRGMNLEDPAFWGGRQAERQAYIHGSLADKMKQLQAEYPLGVVVFDELVSRLETLGITGVTEGSIRKVATDNGLELVAPVMLPEGGVPAGVDKLWRAAAQHAEYRSILDVLLLHRPEDVNGVTFIDELATPEGPIGVSDIDAARARSEQGRDSNALQSAQKLLVAIKTECRDDPSTAALVLATAVEMVQNQLRRGKPKIAVREHLVDAGFDARDAARLVAAVSAQASSTETPGSELGLGQVRQALSDGELAQAERSLIAISPEADEKTEYDALQRDIERLKARKRTSLEDYHAAISRREYVQALAAITEAIDIDQGDETLPDLRDALPPATPRSFTVRAGGAGVLASWANEADTGIVYTLVRAVDHAPASPSDGDVIASGISEPSAVDATAPVGARVNYALFATRDGVLHSDAATAIAFVLLPASDVRFAAGLTDAQISWDRPAASVGSVVTRQDPDGSTVDADVPQGGTYRAVGLKTGMRYRFSVRTVYLLDGARHLSEPTSITVIPRGEAAEVRDLEISERGEGLRATWTGSPGFDVELWSFPPLAAVPEARQLATAALEQYGGVRTALAPGATSSSALLAPVEGFVKVLPLTVLDDGFLTGYGVIAGSAQPATEIAAEAFGHDLRVSWKWPVDDCVMELSWNLDGAVRTRRVTPARYRAEGGVTIVGGRDATELTIATVVRFGDEESVRARTPVPWRAPTVAHSASYSMRIRRSLLGQVTVEAVATSTVTGFRMPVRVVCKHGPVMPWDAEDGRSVDEIELDFTDETTSRHVIDVGKEKPPFWVALFPLDGSELTPPSTRDLKG